MLQGTQIAHGHHRGGFLVVAIYGSTLLPRTVCHQVLYRVSHDSHRGQSHSQSHHVDMCPVCVMCVLRYPIQSYSYTHIQYSRSDVACNAVAGSRHAPRVRVARSLARPTAGITAQRLRAPRRRPKQLGVRFTNERNCGDCVAFVFLITMPPLGGLHRDSGCH